MDTCNNGINKLNSRPSNLLFHRFHEMWFVFRSIEEKTFTQNIFWGVLQVQCDV